MYCYHPEGECDEIIKLASPRLERGVVVDNAKSDAAHTTKLNPSSIRTSHGMFFARGENEVVQGRCACEGVARYEWVQWQPQQPAAATQSRTHPHCRLVI
jgi:hypothetical protein